MVSPGRDEQGRRTVRPYSIDLQEGGAEALDNFGDPLLECGYLLRELLDADGQQLQGVLNGAVPWIETRARSEQGGIA